MTAVDEVLHGLGELDIEDQKYADKSCVRRYLSAVNSDVKKATTLLKNTLSWRKSFQPDTVLTKELEEVAMQEKHYYAGTNEDGYPVMITRRRVRRLLVEEEDSYLRYIVYIADRAISMMKNNQERWVWILDLRGYTSSNSPRVSLTLKIVKLLAEHYPERLKKAYIVDAPTIFSVLYKVVYPFLDQPTRDKTCFIYSAQYSNTGKLLSGKEDMNHFEQYYDFFAEEHDPVQYIAKLKELDEHPEKMTVINST